MEGQDGAVYVIETLKNAGETAQAFYRYVQTPPARAVFRKYGFVLPGEAN